MAMNLHLTLNNQFFRLMKPLLFCISLFGLISIHCTGQARLRKLPANVNHPAINLTSPYISFDGGSLIFISDNSDENQLTMFYTTKRDAVNWKDPVMLPRTVNNRLNFLNGFALNADGKTLYLSSLKSGGLGGFDLIVSQLKGTTWSEPVNIGLPVNSNGHEACPSVSADEKTLYFMRCEKMDQKSASGCKIMMTKKSRLGKWEEPTELPDFINTGNSQTPRILGDGETLIFSSDQFPQGKGGMDLYMTRWDGTQWSKPLPLDFTNTDKNDQYVTAASLGRYLLRDQPGPRTSELVEILFPEELKPKATLKIEGTVSGLENPSSPYISVYDMSTQKRVLNDRPEKSGAFTLFLKEGTKYDLSVEPERETYTYYSKIYDLSGDRIPQLDKVQVSLQPVSAGVELDCSIEFDEGTSTCSRSSQLELKRLSRMTKGNPGRKFVIDVTLYGYITDSIQSSPDLTEVIIDTLRFKVEKLVPDTVRIDSLVAVLNRLDSLHNVNPDTVIVSNQMFRNQIDSMRNNALMTVMVDSIAIKKTYHNNRTEAQARAISNYLIAEGTDASKLQIKHKAIPEADPDKRRTTVKVKVE